MKYSESQPQIIRIFLTKFKIYIAHVLKYIYLQYTRWSHHLMGRHFFLICFPCGSLETRTYILSYIIYSVYGLVDVWFLVCLRLSEVYIIAAKSTGMESIFNLKSKETYIYPLNYFPPKMTEIMPPQNWYGQSKKA